MSDIGKKTVTVTLDAMCSKLRANRAVVDDCHARLEKLLDGRPMPTKQKELQEYYAILDQRNRASIEMNGLARAAATIFELLPGTPEMRYLIGDDVGLFNILDGDADRRAHMLNWHKRDVLVTWDSGKQQRLVGYIDNDGIFRDLKNDESIKPGGISAISMCKDGYLVDGKIADGVIKFASL
jgi:hypothetical protein